MLRQGAGRRGTSQKRKNKEQTNTAGNILAACFVFFRDTQIRAVIDGEHGRMPPASADASDEWAGSAEVSEVRDRESGRNLEHEDGNNESEVRRCS